MKYASSIYFHSIKDLYVNLFIPSKVDWEETSIVQETVFPSASTTTFTIEGKQKDFALRLRYPSWATMMQIKVNGKSVKATKGTDGYVAIYRLWKAGDKITVDFGMRLKEEATKDDASKVALVYGPVVMAGKLEQVEHPFSDPTKYNDYYTFDFKIPAATVEKAKYANRKCIELIPFYNAHHCRYVVYWQK